MEASNEITIFAITDNHYIVLLAALIKSIESNHTTGEKLSIYLVEDKVSENSKEMLQQSIKPDMTALHWMKMEDCLPENISLPTDKSSYPMNIYMRLFIPGLLPKHVKKAIYLDVDMILQKDVSMLWNQQLEGRIIAAVQDPRIKVMSNSWGGIANFRELGFTENTMYFNTGLMVIDVDQFIKNNIAEKVIECVNANMKFVNYPDQYGLNVVLANQWLELDPLWNHFASEYNAEAHLIHFVERKPMYRSYYYSEEYRKLFFRYLKSTRWKDFSPISEPMRYFKKTMNIQNKNHILVSQRTDSTFSSGSRLYVYSPGISGGIVPSARSVFIFR